MFLQNPFYSFIYQYTNDVNDKKENGYTFDMKYKCYDHEENSLINFKCFNINCTMKNPNGVIIADIRYDNYLEFTFNKNTNEVYINHVPVYKMGNVKIPIFTSDIAEIIKIKLNKYTSMESINLKFDDEMSPLVFDKNIGDIISSVQKTTNYKITIKIMYVMKKEIEKVNKTIASYKAHQERNIRIMETIYNKKRKIYGIDPINYSSINEFYEAINEEIKTRIGHILIKIDRHINSTKEAYKKLLFKQFTDNFNKNQELNKSIYTEEQLLKKLKAEKLKNNVFSTLLDEKHYIKINDSEIIGDDDFNNESTYYDYSNTYNVINSEIINSAENDYEIYEKVIDIIWHYDLEYKDGLLYKAKRAQDLISGYILEEYFHNWQSLNIEFIEEYGDTHFLKAYLYSQEEKYLQWRNEIERESKAVSEATKNATGIIMPNISMNYTSPLFQGINLILQYNSLNNEKQYYQNILNNIEDFTISADKQSNLQGYIIQLPYWFRLGAGFQKKSLLMIKPGCNFIDIKKIPYMKETISRQQYKYNLKAFQHSRYYSADKQILSSNEREPISITIPKSLPYIEIQKIIQYFRNEYKTILYICEDSDTYSKVKSIIVDYCLNDYKSLKKDNKIIDSFICIDPNYYDEFFKTTPRGEVFYHRYDYTSNYKFRKKHIMSIEDLCNIYISREEEKNGKDIDYDKIKVSILGSYNSSDFNKKTLYTLDEYKYTALNYYIRIPSVYRKNEQDKKIYYNCKKINDDFYDVFGKQDPDLKIIFNKNDVINDDTVFKEEEIYRLLSLDENAKNIDLEGKFIGKCNRKYRILSEEEVANDIATDCRFIEKVDKGYMLISLFDDQSKDDQIDPEQFDYIYNYCLGGLFSLTDMIMVTEYKNKYRELSTEEIEIDMHQLGKINHINVALFSGYNVVLWKNFPYVPLIKEEIPLDKVKTYIKTLPIIQKSDD